MTNSFNTGAQYPVRKPAVFSNQKLVPSKEHEMKITKGLPKAYDCSLSPNGCCWDGRTPAFGPAGKGCPRKYFFKIFFQCYEVVMCFSPANRKVIKNIFYQIPRNLCGLTDFMTLAVFTFHLHLCIFVYEYIY